MLRRLLIFLVPAMLAVHSAVVPSRAATEDRVLDSPLPMRLWSSVAGFFSFGVPSPPSLRAALVDLEAGHRFAALARAGEALDESGAGPFAVEAHLIRGLVFAELGWDDLAQRSFVELLEEEEVSPYYPLALLGLVESHHRGGHAGAVADAYRRYFDEPWNDQGARGRRVRNLFNAYGDLRAGTARPTAEESELLVHGKALRERLRERRERPADRISYLASLDLFRLGEHERSLSAFRRLAITSPYYPYGLYTSVQALHALGHRREAEAAVRILLTYPVLDTEEQLLAERARLLHAQLLFEAGSSKRALRVAGELAGDGALARQARLLRAEICLETGQPSLALAYLADLGVDGLEPRMAAGRAFGLGEAYAALGDHRSAVEALRSGVVALEEARRGDASADAEALEAAIRQSVARGLERAGRRRRRIAAGISRVLDYRGPLNLGKLLRVTFVSHRDTVVGEPVFDLQRLAADVLDRPEPMAGDRLWLDYLESRERPAIEAAQAWLGEDTAAGEDSREKALHVLEADLALLEGRFPTESPGSVAPAAARWVARLRAAGLEDLPSLVLDPDAPLAAQIAAYRSRFVLETAGRVEPLRLGAGELATAHEETRDLVQVSVQEGIRRFLSRRDESLRRLEYDLESALSQALAREVESSSPARRLP